MNFLAHTFLSGKSEEILIGNFIADFLKGNQFEDYSATIVDGIFLHRKIDSFTDQHEVVRQSIQRLRQDYGKYSGVIVDIYYDHYLAMNWHKYAKRSLHEHAQYVYRVLEKNIDILPPKVQEVLPYMVKQNWLAGYANLENIGRALTRVSERISKRTQYDSKIELAIKNLETGYREFENDFNVFFPDMIVYINAFLSKIHTEV
ncbi:ACP phosphodiesterase [uncultured Microscilla sp.]|nr:ACP phosphodiesterase [uncultured Microscilla sp.]